MPIPGRELPHLLKAMGPGLVVLAIVPSFATGGEPILRKPPLRELSVKKVIRVEEFGARADDASDDLPAVQAAIDEAVGYGVPTEITCSKGRYDLYPKGGGGTSLTIEGGRDIVIDGHGADFVIRNPQKGFLGLRDCERVIVKDVSLDYDPLPFTQGRVKAVDDQNHTLLVELEPGFPSLENQYFRTGTHRWGLIKNKHVPRMLKPGLPNVTVLKDWEKVAERTFRIETMPWCTLELVEPGDPYVQLARRNGASAFSIVFSSRITLMDIRIFSSPAASYVPLRCSLINFLRCKTEPKEGRWHSTCADGIYSLWCRIGPWIEGCVFDAIADDCVVVKTKGANCIAKIDDQTFILKGRPGRDGLIPPVPMEAGDTLQVFDPTGGRFIGDATVVSVELEKSAQGWRGPMRVVIDKDLPGVVPGADWGSQIFYNDNTVAGSFVIRNNTFRNIRRWGILCASHDGVIEKNLFEGTSAHAILISNADQGHHDSDGFVSRNILIRNNTFRDCCHQDPTQISEEFSAMVATVVTGVTDPKTPFKAKVGPWQGQRNITIEGNRFMNWRHVPALRIGCARDVVIRENTFETAGDPPTPPAIVVFNASRIKVERNRISGPWKSPEQAIIVDAKTTTAIDLIDNVVHGDRR